MSLVSRTRETGLNKPTTWLLVVALVLSILHISDHVLRVDHSGWPFRPEVTPFTFSLLALPIVLFALFGPRRFFWLRWALLLFATLATLYAHIAVETPHMQFAMWADDRSADPRQQGFHNIPEVRSSVLGLLSMGVAMTLNVVAVTSTIAMLARGGRLRRMDDRHDAP